MPRHFALAPVLTGFQRVRGKRNVSASQKSSVLFLIMLPKSKTNIKLYKLKMSEMENINAKLACSTLPASHPNESRQTLFPAVRIRRNHSNVSHSHCVKPLSTDCCASSFKRVIVMKKLKNYHIFFASNFLRVTFLLRKCPR